MNLLGIVITLASIAGALLLMKKETTEAAVDVYADYPLFLDSAMSYKEEHNEFAKDILMLGKRIPKYVNGVPKCYGLSLDGKFLTVNGLDESLAQKLINDIGGTSYINGKVTYLTLLRINDVSDIVPIAHFSVLPEGKITTTTPLSYDTSACIAENNEIIEKKWENKANVFHEPGVYTVRLKIKDRNGNWSEPFERDVKVTEVAGVSDLVSYDGTFFVLYHNGKLLSSSKNEYGQLGVGTLNPSPDLKHNSFHDGVVEIACGEGFCVYRFFDGSVCTAGNNRHGELANGDKNSHKTMVSVWGLENIKQVAAGKRFAAALDLEGNVFVWGDNTDGQLMQDGITESPYPVRLEGVTGVKQIACGTNFGLALKYDGTVIGWGDNTHGQLALGFKGRIYEPAVTQYIRVKSVHCGDKYSLVVSENGRIYGAGNNAYGQLGSKGKSEYTFPEEVLRIKDVEHLKVCDSLSIAVNNIGKTFVWGNFNSPGAKPIYEPYELPHIQYASVIANDGKKAYVLDSQNEMYTVSDILGKYDHKKIHDNIYDFIEKQSK